MYQNHDPWWNNDCQLNRKLRRRAERAYRKNRTTQSRKAYKKACERAGRVIGAVRNKYYRDRFEKFKGDSKQTHGIVKHLLGNKPKPKYPDGASDVEVAEKLANYFKTKVVNLNEQLAEESEQINVDFPSSTCQSEFSTFNHLSQLDIVKIIATMTSKTSDLDIIPGWLFKECASELSLILQFIVNSSFDDVSYPSALKEAVITPILKKTNLDPDQLANYRPVSNLSFVAKLVEKCAFNQLNCYLNENDLLSPYQSGYRKFHSCETAMARVHNDLLTGGSPTCSRTNYVF